MKITYSDKVDRYNKTISKCKIYTEDGELIELDKRCIDNLSMDLVNEGEKIENESKNKGYEKSKQIKKSSDLFKMAIDEYCGSFYFDFYKRFNTKIESQFIFRFLYLCTFMNYDNLLSNGKRLIVEDDLFIIFKLSRSEFFKTKKVLLENNMITINKNKNILINDNLCKKGEILKKKNIEVVRMFNNAIKELYETALPKEHKKLALLIDILPYVNLKYNIICKNIEEESIENIKSYTLKELCEIINYDKTHSSRLKSDLLKLKVNNQKVVAITNTSDTEIITINPIVYYKGTDLDDLEYLINIFKVSN